MIVSVAEQRERGPQQRATRSEYALCAGCLENSQKIQTLHPRSGAWIATGEYAPPRCVPVRSRLFFRDRWKCRRLGGHPSTRDRTGSPTRPLRGRVSGPLARRDTHSRSEVGAGRLPGIPRVPDSCGSFTVNTHFRSVDLPCSRRYACRGIDSNSTRMGDQSGALSLPRGRHMIVTSMRGEAIDAIARRCDRDEALSAGTAAVIRPGSTSTKVSKDRRREREACAKSVPFAVM